MLSMFKDKKGFSVLFRDAEKDASIVSRDIDASVRRSSRASGTVARHTGGSDLAQLQCQRCSKRFSALEDAPTEEQSCCRRCGYPTCPQCREAAAGTPPWVCCVCDGSKSFMWLLERTKMGPRLVSKIAEYCDPRGQRLMRSMFRFTLQQYRAVSSPRPSLAIAAGGRASGSRAGSGGASTTSRPTTSHTPPAPIAPSSKSRTSGERGAGSTGLSAVLSSHSNVHRPSPYSHPKHASLLRSAGLLSGPAVDGKENAPAWGGEAAQLSESPKRPHGSEALRRDDVMCVVEYSPAPDRQVVKAETTVGKGGNFDDVSPLSAPPSHLLGGEDRCTAVQDIYRASDTSILSRQTLTMASTGEEVSASPHVRPSGRAAFQREAPRQLPPNATAATNSSHSDLILPTVGEPDAVPLNLDATAMSITPPGQPCRLGRSLSRASSGSGRSESPAPRFPSFAQFLDDQAAVGAGQTQLPRESDVLVTVSSDSSEEDERNSNVVELGGTRSSRFTVKSNKGGLCTPRGTQPRTPPSARESSSRRKERRISGLSGDYTPTRALDLSDARATTRHGSSSRRRTTRGSLLEMHAPHLYGSGGGGTGRRSGQIGDSPFVYDLPSHFSSHSGGKVLSARGQVRRPHAQLTTRTAGRALGGGGGSGVSVHEQRVRLARQNSRTTTPLQRTASRNGALQRVPSGSRTLARTNSSNAQFARKNSSTAPGSGFGRMHSGTRQLTRTPSSRTRLVGVPASPNPRGHPLQRTESTKLVRTASATFGLPQRRAEAPASASSAAALERTHSHYGLAGRSSPLKRTASHTNLSGPSPFCRLNSVTAFTRSATATAGFTRTNSATVFGRSAYAGGEGGDAAGHHGSIDAARHLHGASSSGFARTATGTYLAGGDARPRAGAFTSRPAAPRPISYARRRGAGGSSGAGGPRSLSARKRTPCGRTGAATPLQRTDTASRTATTTNTAIPASARPPTPTAFARTASGVRAFERQPSGTARQATHAPVAGGRALVDPAPALVGVARRKTSAGAGGLRRTPSAMSRTNSTAGAAAGATPRTPRPYIISSVSIAATPAPPLLSSGVHGGVRPVLSSGTCSPKTRSTRDSQTSGSAGTTRTSGGGGTFGSVSTTPVVKAPNAMALAGRTSAPRRRPEAATTAASIAGRGNVASPNKARAAAFTRLGTGTRNGAAAPAAGTAGAPRDARSRTGSAHPPAGFVRTSSRPIA